VVVARGRVGNPVVGQTVFVTRDRAQGQPAYDNSRL